MSDLSFVFPDKVRIKATEGAVWHNKRSQYTEAVGSYCKYYGNIIYRKLTDFVVSYGVFSIIGHERTSIQTH
jgi:hypothetical protein